MYSFVHSSGFFIYTFVQSLISLFSTKRSTSRKCLCRHDEITLHLFVRLFIHSFLRIFFIYSFIYHSFIRLFIIHLFVYLSFIYSFIYHSFIRSYIFHLFVYFKFNHSYILQPNAHKYRKCVLLKKNTISTVGLISWTHLVDECNFRM